MKKYLYFIMLLLVCASCGNKKSSNDEMLTQICNNTHKEGYNKGYQQGKEDGSNCYSHGYGYDDTCYYAEEPTKSYKEGYKEGYEVGYNEGKEEYEDELRAEQKKMADWHNWDDEDIEGFYVELEGCENSEQADYISREYYEGEYIEDWGRYFAKTSVNSGESEIELGERVSRKLFAIKGTNTFIHFKWSTSLSRGDEGVIDVFGSRGTFYKKPD